MVWQRDTDVVLYESGAAPIGAAGNNYDDGDQDSSNYAYDSCESSTTLRSLCHCAAFAVSVRCTVFAALHISGDLAAECDVI